MFYLYVLKTDAIFSPLLTEYEVYFEPGIVSDNVSGL